MQLCRSPNIGRAAFFSGDIGQTHVTSAGKRPILKDVGFIFDYEIIYYI